MKIFDWQEQLDVGDVGEKDFCQYYSVLEPVKSKDFAIDFVLRNGWSVELKTDTYDMLKTPNFFMELYSNEQKKLGGPWRAKKDGITLFCYYFKKNKTFFWFEPAPLADLVDEIVRRNHLSTVNIVNDGWTAAGYKIARKEVESLCVRKDVF